MQCCNWRKWIGRQEVIALLFVLILLLPNLFLAVTEPYSWSTVLASILLPMGVYMGIVVVRPRPGGMILLTLPLMVLGAFQIVLIYLFGGSIIAVDMFTNLFTTNVSEAGELLANIWPAVVFVCVVYVPLLVLGVRSLVCKTRVAPCFRRVMLWGALSAVVLGGVFAGISACCHAGFGIRYHIFPVNVIYNIKLTLDRWAQSEQYPQTSAAFTFDVKRSQTAKDREIYVFVIGEASRASSWSLFGYDRETTPQLQRRVGDGLVPFSDVLTQSNATHKSVPVLLSSISAEDYTDVYTQKSIITAFKEVGFKTLFMSNQVPNRSLIDFFSQEADSRIDISPREGQLYTDNRPDGDMLPYLRDVLRANEDNLFIVLHTYGSHFDFTKRYPTEFARFVPDHATSVNRENRDIVHNAYDNSIYYTDYVLDQVISLLDSTQVCSALVYCADHGEDLMDDDRNRFLHASPTPTYYQLHVSSFVWFSPEYREQFPDKYAMAQANSGKPSSTDAIFHNIADIAFLHSAYMDSTRAYTSTGFTPHTTRRYLNDYNQAVEFYNTGLCTEDFKMLDSKGIEYDKTQVRDILY